MIVQHWAHMPFDELMITNPFKKKLYGDIAGDGSDQYNNAEVGIHTKWMVRKNCALLK